MGHTSCHTQDNSPREMILNPANFLSALFWGFIAHILGRMMTNYSAVSLWKGGKAFPISLTEQYTLTKVMSFDF